MPKLVMWTVQHLHQAARPPATDPQLAVFVRSRYVLHLTSCPKLKQEWASRYALDAARAGRTNAGSSREFS
jgi:hypothetical protein